MKCPICNDETAGEKTRRWGPEWAHARCIRAYDLGRADALATISQPQPAAPVPAVPEGLVALLTKRASDSYSCSLLAKDALALLSAAPQPVDDNSPSDLDYDPQQEGEAPAVLPQPPKGN